MQYLNVPLNKYWFSQRSNLKFKLLIHEIDAYKIFFDKYHTLRKKIKIILCTSDSNDYGNSHSIVTAEIILTGFSYEMSLISAVNIDTDYT